MTRSIAAAKALISADSASITAVSDPNFAAAAQSSAGPLAGLAHGANLTADNLWVLDNSDASASQQNVQFFCGVANTPAHSTFTFPSLPPSRYAVAFVHATGITHPQQLGLVLKDESGTWRIAGFAFRPLTLAGHDSLWYWSHAREYAKSKQSWSAYFYYVTSVYLAAPVAYISTGNLEKLQQEQQASAPTDLPRIGHPLLIASATGTQFQVTDLTTDGSLGGLDLVIRYSAADISDPAATRQKNIELMRAILLSHPDVRSAFHGLWVYAVAPNQPPFGIEIPMDEIH